MKLSQKQQAEEIMEKITKQQVKGATRGRMSVQMSNRHDLTSSFLEAQETQAADLLQQLEKMENRRNLEHAEKMEMK